MELAWSLQDLKTVPQNGLKVFSCFHCGGGSTMGYKLAGFTVLGGVDIDKKMVELYRANHKPKLSFQMSVVDFAKQDKFPDELHALDILDGSPPCSSFSIAGLREKAWQKKKKFAEGQEEQILDNLFFDFIGLAKKFQPKIIVAENVKGLIMANARGYVKQIFEAYDQAGYDTQLFLLNASTMGVPQRRERVFFVSRRKDLSLKPIELSFNEQPISVIQAFEGLTFSETQKPLTPKILSFLKKTLPGNSFAKVANGSFFSHYRLALNAPANTVASSSLIYHPVQHRLISKDEIIRLQSFPYDYNFLKNEPMYVCGMSVPPFMMQRVATQIAKQFFDK